MPSSSKDGASHNICWQQSCHKLSRTQGAPYFLPCNMCFRWNHQLLVYGSVWNKIPVSTQGNKYRSEKKWKLTLLIHLAMLADDVPVVSNDHDSVPNGLPMINISFKNRINNHHVVFLCKFLKKLSWFPIKRLSKFAPSLLPSTEGKRHHPCFLHHIQRSNRLRLPQCPSIQ